MRVSPAALRAPRWLIYVAALLAGALAALGLAPVGYWALTLLSLSTLALWFMQPRAPRQAGLLLWLYGAGYFGVGLRWLVEPFQIEAELFGWMAPIALVLMALGLALFWAAAGWVTARWARSARHAAALLVCSLAVAELARAYLFTGFPWAGLAQIWIDTPMRQLLAVVGPQGLGFATLLLAAIPVLIWPARAVMVAPLPTLALLGSVTLVPAPTSAPPDVDAPVFRIVQPNAPQDEKWAPATWQTFFWRQVDATAAGVVPDVVVWPETALPQLLSHADEALAIIAEAARGVPVVFGIQRRNEASLYYNSLVIMGTDGAVTDVYDKHHLVPFGEYMPAPALFRSLGIRALALRAQSGFSAGPGPRALDIPGVGAALPLICYEAVFPQHASAETRPRVLLQITNDAWFGTYAGPQQHLAQARMRAVEQGVPLVRSANTGISAMIDARGAVTASLPLGTDGYVDAPLPPRAAPTLYSRTGDTPFAVFLLIACVCLAAIRPKHRSV